MMWNETRKMQMNKSGKPGRDSPRSSSRVFYWKSVSKRVLTLVNLTPDGYLKRLKGSFMNDITQFPPRRPFVTLVCSLVYVLVSPQC